MTSESVVSSYFQNLEQAMSRHGITNKPHRIFNVDVKGMTIDHTPPKVVSCSVKPQAVTSGRGKTITILGCGSAGGVSIPPYFVFPGKRFFPKLLAGATPGTNGTMTDSGWSNGQVFREYLEQHFIKFLPGGTSEPTLLILDGHKSHVSVGLVEWAIQHNIYIFVLPAHTSHLLQPLDVGVFGPFQRMYNNLCHKFIRCTSGIITRYNVCELACKAYTKALSADNLQSAFKKTGICPLDMNAIDKSKLIPATLYEDEVQEKLYTDSQSTVEGGVITPETCLLVREENLRRVKQEMASRWPRNSLSKVVSGKEVTEDTVLNQIKEHELGQKGSKKSKFIRSKKCLSVSQPGPSHIIIDNEVLNLDTDDDDDIPCYVCNLRSPPSNKRPRGLLEILEWGQCDGIKDGKPCLHWVHLKYCCETTSLGKFDKFYCPHCLEE